MNKLNEVKEQISNELINYIKINNLQKTAINLPNNRICYYEDQQYNNHDFSYCEYRYLGTLANGVQVVYYYEDSYGSFNPDGLFGFKFTKEKVKGDKGKHIFMKLVNSVGINQNVKFQLDEEHNRVLVIPQSNLAAADFRDKTGKPYWVNFN